MNALVVPILLACLLVSVAAFVVWMTFTRSEKNETPGQHNRSQRGGRTPA